MFAGAGVGSRDSGVSDTQMGMWLTFMSERPPGIYIVATCNSIAQLMQASSGAFTRSGRFDALFMVDIPSASQRAEIWSIYKDKLKLPEQPSPDDLDWTGADIESACRNARLTGKSLLEIATQVIPTAVTAKEQIDELRNWAHRRCLSADYAGLYDKNGPSKTVPITENKLRRKVTRA